MSDPDFWVICLLYPCLYGIVVDILALIFNRIAVALNAYENHRTDTAHWNRYVQKAAYA